jgi:hypothetical protein
VWAVVRVRVTRSGVCADGNTHAAVAALWQSLAHVDAPAFSALV